MQITVRLLEFLAASGLLVVGPAMSEVLKPFVAAPSGLQSQRKSTSRQNSGQTPQSKSTYHSPVFSPDGRKLAFIQQESNSKKSQANQRLCLADLDGRTLFCFPEVFIEPSSGLAFSVAMQRPSFSPDGQTILFAANTQDYACGAVFVAHLDATHIRRLSACQSHPTDSTFSPDGKHVAFIGSDKINVIDLEGRIVSRFPADIQESVQSRFTFSPDGKQILYVSMHGITEKFNVYLENFQDRTRTKVAELQQERHADTIPTASISPDGKAVVLTMPIGPRNPLRQEYALSQYELLTTIVGVGARARLTNDNNFDEQPIFVGNGAGIVFISTKFTSSTKPEKIESRICTMDVDGNNLKTIATAKRIQAFSVSPNARRVAFEGFLSQGDTDIFLINFDGTDSARLRDLLSVRSVSPKVDVVGKGEGRPGHTNARGTLSPDVEVQPRVFTGHTRAVTSVAFSPDGRSILSGGQDQSVRLWDAQSGNERRRFSGHKAAILDVAFLPDGRKILSCSDDNTVRLWDVGTGREMRRFVFPGIHTIRVSPDGQSVLSITSKFLMSTTLEESVFLWDIKTGRKLRVFTKGINLGIQDAAFSGDGKYAAYEGQNVDSRGLGGGNDSVHLLDSRSGREIKRFDEQTEPLYGVAFSPDGRYVLSGGADKTVRLWDVESGRQIRIFAGHTGSVGSVAFSHDGRRVLSGEGGFQRVESPTVRIWDRDSGKELARFSGHLKPINMVAFSPDDRLAISGSDDGAIRLWVLPK